MQPSTDAKQGDIAVTTSATSEGADHGEVAPAESSIKPGSNRLDHPHTARLKIVSGTTSAKSNSAPHPDTIKALQHQLLSNRQATILKTAALFLDQKDLRSALIAVCESLHRTFGCVRVVAGSITDGKFDLVHISQQSSFDPRSGEAHLLIDAMQEACDQDQLIHFSVGIDASDNELTIVESHRAVLSGIRRGQICTIPISDGDNFIGAILLEAHDADLWSPLTTQLQSQVVHTIAPMVALRKKSEISATDRLIEDSKARLTRWVSPRHAIAKLSVAATALILLLAALVPVSHQVNTTAELVSTERRLITSPILGYVEKVHVNVGETVTAGQALLDLDVRDLKLQADQQQLQIESGESEYRSAMASHDRKEMAVVQAQLDQLRSELALVESQITRSQMVAPVDGMIISGDLSQLIGAPVERGTTLLEMAPATDFEIQLAVREADIGYIKSGQKGELTLKSSPFEPISFSVDSIHPIAVTGEGSARFTVVAEPSSDIQHLRPGQTGIAKLDAGKAKLLWTWTHRLTSWMKLKLWGWF